MALGVGVAGVRTRGKSSGKNEGDDSFGLTGMASIGPIMAVCVYGIILNFFSKGSSGSEQIAAHGADAASGSLSLGIFIHILPGILKEVTMALLPLVAMFAIMYFLLILPEKKRTKKYNEMLSALKVNDEVLTRGGIIGKIITIDEDQMVIQSGPDRVRFRVTKNSIAQKLNKDAV